MTAQPALPGMATEADRRAAETDTAEREDDPTPGPLVAAVLEAAIGSQAQSKPAVPICLANGRMVDRAEWSPPLRVLDVCAGYGVWAQRMRALAARHGWPVHITGVELCEARREHLAKWCDDVHIGPWSGRDSPFPLFWDREWMIQRWEPEDIFDIALGNPYFTALTHEDPEQSMPAVLLRHAPAVLLLHTQQAFVRGRAGREVWRRYPAAAAWLVPGAVGFRGPGQGTDSRCYQVSLWLRGHEGPTAVHMLPELPAEARRWVVPPGSEEPSEELPSTPGWTP